MLDISNLRLSLNWESDTKGFGQLRVFKNDDGSYFVENEAINKESILHILKSLVNDFEKSDVVLDIENNTTHNMFTTKTSPRIPNLFVICNEKTNDKLYVKRLSLNTYEHHGTIIHKKDSMTILPVHGFRTFEDAYNSSLESQDYVKKFLEGI